MPISIDGVDYRFVSVDDHVQETPAVWTDRLPAALRDRAPRLVADGDGERWVVDGRPLPSTSAAPVTETSYGGAPRHRRWSDVPAELHDPAARLQAMDREGVDVSVLYPGVAGAAGETFGRITDPELELACVRAYNDWLIDEWAAASPRFVPLCLVPLHPVEAAVAELERAVARGHRGLIYPALPMFLRDVPQVSATEQAPLWEACAALGVPVSFHSGCADEILAPAPPDVETAYVETLRGLNRPISSALFVAHLLLSQVLAPHPGLRAVFPENSVAWMGFALETMDYLVSVDRLHVDTYDLMPSEVFARQCYTVGSYERLDLCSTDLAPVGNVLWSTGFPGTGTTWPDTRDTIATGLGTVPDDDRRRVLWDNAEGLYRLADIALPAATAGRD